MSEPKDYLEFVAGLSTPPLYDWQAQVGVAIEEAATSIRKNIALCAPNEAGKTSTCIALPAMYWLYRSPRCKIQITSASRNQIADQLWPVFKEHQSKFQGWHFRDHEKVIETREGGRLRAFATDDGGKVEGAHAGPDSPLLIIVDEAKSVDEEIFQAIDRCGYNVLFYVSSPWLKEGRFFDAFSSQAASFIQFQVGLTQCPHIPPEKIKDMIARYGERHPITRSSLYAEFVDTVEGVSHLITLGELDVWKNSMIPFISGPTVIGIDIAGGGDDTALVQRVGNRLKRIATCKYESTTDTTSWIVDQLFNAGYKRGCGWQILIDATAIGRGPYDQLRKQEIPVLPFNFGGKRGKTSSRDTSRHFDHSNANLAFMSRSNRP